MAPIEPPRSPAPSENASPNDRSAESSNPASRDGSRPPNRRKNVQFAGGGESLDTENHKAAFEIRDETNQLPRPKPLPRPRSNTGARKGSPAAIGRGRSPARISEGSEDIADSRARAPVPQPRPSIMRLPSSNSDIGDSTEQGKEKDDGSEGEEQQEDADENAADKVISQQTAQGRAERLSRTMGSHSAPGSRFSSPQRPSRTNPRSHPPVIAKSPPPSPPPEGQGATPLDLDHLPLKKLRSRRKYGIDDDTDEEDEAELDKPSEGQRKQSNRFYKAATRLVKTRTKKNIPKLFRVHAGSPESLSGTQTPLYERDPDHYVPRPKEYREGYLSSLLKLYNEQGVGSALAHIPGGPDSVTRAAHRRGSNSQSLLPSRRTSGGTPSTTPRATSGVSPVGSPTSSGTTTPKPKHQKWYYKTPQSQSTGALAELANASTVLAQPGTSKLASAASTEKGCVKPNLITKQKPLSGHAMDTLDTVLGKKKKRAQRRQDSIQIQVHLAETVQRVEYLVMICKCLMMYGAPTHRMEEYLRYSARVLEINGQFLYIPGCMIMSFDDAATHTAEVKIIRSVHGISLGKLRDVHEVYKEVVHDLIDVQEAMGRLRDIQEERDLYNKWLRVFVYGLASATVGPFAFGGRLIDIPIAFFTGSLLGWLQLILAPVSELYSNIFEISAAVATSFLARAFGSIGHGNVFCFSAIAQSSITMILPGYTVLCGSLELQSRNIVAGSVRMVYAVIYSLFLGYGITIGTSIYGAMDKSATSAISCRGEAMPFWFKLIFVIPFTICIVIINQARLKQMPVMIGIAFVGYIVNYFSAKRFAGNGQIANTLGALAIGLLGNFYSRLRHGLAVTALIPAIFVQVPSGLSAGASLVSGITSANQINSHNNGTYSNGTTTVSDATTAGTVNSMVFNVAYSIIQVAIGITVGLFLSALIVYPFGKRRSGLFSF